MLLPKPWCPGTAPDCTVEHTGMLPEKGIRTTPTPTPTRAPKSYRELQFYAKVTKTFLQHDDLSNLPLHDIRVAVEQSMPVSLVLDILEGVNSFLRSRSQSRPVAKRRRSLDGDGHENMAYRPGHEAPRLSFICNFASANEMPGGQVGRTYETVRV